VAAREAAARCAAGEDWAGEEWVDSDDEYPDPARSDPDDPAELDDQNPDELDSHDDDDPEAADYPGLPRLPPSPLPERPRGTVVLELDDEDPELHDLDSQLRRGYRRAAGQ
jgi:hypothetical protein